MRFSLSLLILCPFFLSAGITDNYPPLSVEERAAFVQKMDETVNASQNRLDAALYSSSNNPASISANLKAKIYINDVASKKIIMGKFVGSEKARSPIVQNALLELLNSDPMEVRHIQRFQLILHNEETAPLKEPDPVLTP